VILIVLAGKCRQNNQRLSPTANYENYYETLQSNYTNALVPGCYNLHRFDSKNRHKNCIFGSDAQTGKKTGGVCPRFLFFDLNRENKNKRHFNIK
jgi:hypothetical protein